MRYDLVYSGIVLCSLPTRFDIEALRPMGLVPDGAEIVAVVLPEDVRVECYRRLRQIHGATDDVHMANIAADDTRERMMLLGIPVASRTKEQVARLEDLKLKDASIEEILTSYNNMIEPFPTNYADDVMWVVPKVEPVKTIRSRIASLVSSVVGMKTK